MKKHFIILMIFFSASIYAQQPPKWQAINECNQAKKLYEQIAELKNNGANKSDCRTVISMSSEGNGVMGDLALVFFYIHKKRIGSDKCSKRMYQRCMHSNGY